MIPPGGFIPIHSQHPFAKWELPVPFTASWDGSCAVQWESVLVSWILTNDPLPEGVLLEIDSAPQDSLSAALPPGDYSWELSAPGFTPISGTLEITGYEAEDYVDIGPLELVETGGGELDGFFTFSDLEIPAGLVDMIATDEGNMIIGRSCMTADGYIWIIMEFIEQIEGWKEFDKETALFYLETYWTVFLDLVVDLFCIVKEGEVIPFPDLTTIDSTVDVDSSITITSWYGSVESVTTVTYEETKYIVTDSGAAWDVAPVSASFTVPPSGLGPQNSGWLVSGPGPWTFTWPKIIINAALLNTCSNVPAFLEAWYDKYWATAVELD